METPTCQDWDFLQDSTCCSNTDTIGRFDEGEDVGDSDNGISPDYFALDSRKRYLVTGVSEEVKVGGEEEGNLDPSWIDPGSYSSYSRRTIRESGLKGIGISNRDFGGSWISDESSDDQTSQTSPFEHCAESGVVATAEYEDGFCGRGCSKGREDADRVKVDSSCFDELGPDDSSKISDHEEKNPRIKCSKDGDANGDKSGKVWWKLPLEFMKFYAFKFKPVLSLSIIAALMGFIFLGRKLHKLKRNPSDFPIKVNINDKNASQFVVHSTRLNEAFSMIKRVPIIRNTLSASGMPVLPSYSWSLAMLL